MEIRNPNKSHLPELLNLLERCFSGVWTAEDVAGRIFYDEHYDPNHVWMAREAGQTLGFLHTLQVGERAWIKLLAVAPEARRRGLGRDLLSRAEFRLSGEGAKEIRVESTPPREFLPGVIPESDAALFFKACGYEAAAPLPLLHAAPRPGILPPEPDRQVVARFAREVCGEHWGWAEEQLSWRPAHLAYRADAGLCLAEPGESLGPLWPVDGAGDGPLHQLVQDALAVASSAPARGGALRVWTLEGGRPLPGLETQGDTYLPFIKRLT